MEMRLHRYDCTDERTIGRLFIHGYLQAYTLEDPVHDGPKIAGRTAIPTGRYQVMLSPSARFHRVLPILLHVPGFEGIRIHPGNTSADTAGCILVGMRRGLDDVLDSREAMAAVQMMIADALTAGDDVWITIEPAIPEGTLLA